MHIQGCVCGMRIGTKTSFGLNSNFKSKALHFLSNLKINFLFSFPFFVFEILIFQDMLNFAYSSSSSLLLLVLILSKIYFNTHLLIFSFVIHLKLWLAFRPFHESLLILFVILLIFRFRKLKVKQSYWHM